MTCNFVSHGETSVRCTKCGRVVSTPFADRPERVRAKCITLSATSSVSAETPKTQKPKKKKGCGCEKRKRWLNEKIPGAGDLVEKITEATGIKAAVDKWYGH